jgi:hypothetical protein
MLKSVKVVPVAYSGMGWNEVAEGEQSFFATYLYDNHKGYGEGWMPLYDFQTDTKADAYWLHVSQQGRCCQCHE